MLRAIVYISDLAQRWTLVRHLGILVSFKIDKINNVIIDYKLQNYWLQAFQITVLTSRV